MLDPNKSTLLFVDDEERIVNLLRMIFRGNYNVLTATSGAEALKLLAANPVDVLVSDQRMPGMTGIEVLREARQTAPDTIRILLTGYSDLSAIVGSVNEGEVFRFLNKPWDNEGIRQTLADAVSAARAGRAGGAARESVPDLKPGESPEVLLVDDNANDLAAMQELLSAHYKTHTATSLPAALAVLERFDIGVIVTEARVGNANMAGFLRAVKEHYPVITTVMLTNSADADQVINLINRAQIYRFATKPMRRGLFRLALASAATEHLRLRAHPHLTARHRVERGRHSEDDATLFTAVGRSLSRLKSLLGFR